MGEILNLNKLKYEKMYKEFYKFGGLDLRLDNVKRNDNVVAISHIEGNVIILKDAR